VSKYLLFGILLWSFFPYCNTECTWVAWQLRFVASSKPSQWHGWPWILTTRTEVGKQRGTASFTALNACVTWINYAWNLHRWEIFTSLCLLLPFHYFVPQPKFFVHAFLILTSVESLKNTLYCIIEPIGWFD